MLLEFVFFLIRLHIYIFLVIKSSEILCFKNFRAFNFTAHKLALDKTNTQDTFSLISLEFINIMTAIATCHISRKTRMAGLSENITYGDLINDLSSAWRMVSIPYPPKRNNQGRIHYRIRHYSPTFGEIYNQST